jgi:hypothetical protein
VESRAVEAWLDEEDHRDAVMMYGRVQVQRALDASRSSRPPGVVTRLADTARHACRDAVAVRSEDPVPWVDLLALARLDVGGEWHRRRAEHAVAGPEALAPGPWGLLREADRRDPCNREAYTRMFQVLRSYGGWQDFALWTASWAPEGSPLNLLPLRAHIEVYAMHRTRGRESPLHWANSGNLHHAGRCLERWFRRADARMRMPMDMNLLAHALYSGGCAEGAEVFEAIGAHATPDPWRYIAPRGEWLTQFERARDHYLAGPSKARRRR